MHWVGVRIPRGMIGTKSGSKLKKEKKKKKENLHFGNVFIIHIVMWAARGPPSPPQRYENFDALFMASASSPIRAIHRSINSLFSCLSFRDCASAILS